MPSLFNNLKKSNSEKVSTPKVGVLNIECAFKLRIYRSLKKFNMSQINPKEVFHNTVYSVQLPYIAGHSL